MSVESGSSCTDLLAAASASSCRSNPAWRRASRVLHGDLERVLGGLERRVSALEELEVRLGIHHLALGELRGLGGRELDGDLAHHRLGELAEGAACVFERAV